MTTLLVILLNGLWQGIAIAAITWGALRFSPNVNASTRYAAWTLALLATVVIPVTTSLGRVTFEPSHAPRVTAHAIAPQYVREPREHSSAPQRNPEPSSPFAVPHMPAMHVAPPALLTRSIFVLWALAALALLVRLSVALFKLERLKHDALPLGMDYRDMLPQFQAHSGHSRDVRICTTEGIEVPVAVGLFDAMVLLPQRLLDTLEPSEIDQISLHELSHLLRHDDWSNGFQRLVTALLFFNPAVWFIARQMDIEREVACDDFVLEFTGAVRTYAYCLTKMAEMTSWPHQPLAAPGVFITRKNISIRIERLLRAGRAISSNIAPATAVIVLAGIAASYAIARIATPAIAITMPQPTVMPIQSTAPIARIAASASPSPRVFPSPQRVVVTIPSIDIPAHDIDVPETHVHIPSIHIMNKKIVATIPARGGCSGCNFENANLAGHDFARQDLGGADFQNANVSGAHFDQSNLTGANFTRANLHNATFLAANLTGCDLEDANVDGAQFDGAQLTGCNISMRRLSPYQARSFLHSCTGCDFSNVNLSGQDLRNIKIIGIDLSGANLRNADLSGATLTAVDLSHADFSGANLSGTTFSGCDFSGTNLRYVDLRHTRFVGSSLSDAKMN